MRALALAVSAVSAVSAAPALAAVAPPAANGPEAPVRTGPVLDAGLSLGLPAALPTGLASGLGVGVSTRGLFAWGVRLSAGTATEHTLVWTVRHDELRLRALGAIQAELGRGTLGLRLGAGATEIHELRERKQARRLGLTGDDLETSAWQLLPAVDLEAVARVELAGGFGVGIAGGPSFHWLEGDMLPGFTGGVVATWQP